MLFPNKTQEELSHLFESMLQELATENLNAETLGLPLSKKALELLTGLVNLKYDTVAERNEELSKTYVHLTAAYGFNDFYDLYAYADYCDKSVEQITKGGDKNLSSLTKKKRTVIRNGKPMEMSIYESGEDNKNELDKKKRDGSSNQTSNQKVQASALQLSSKLEKGKQGDKQINRVSSQSESLSNKGVNVSSDYFGTLSDEMGNVRGQYSFVIQGVYLYLASFESDELTTGTGVKAFFELIKQACKDKLGVMVDDNESTLAHELFSEYGLKKKGNAYCMTYKQLVKQLGGETPWDALD
jgi:ketosteroid isomerase-like protein